MRKKGAKPECWAIAIQFRRLLFQLIKNFSRCPPPVSPGEMRRYAWAPGARRCRTARFSLSPSQDRGPSPENAALTSATTRSLKGVATPVFRPSATISPFSQSISGLRARAPGLPPSTRLRPRRSSASNRRAGRTASREVSGFAPASDGTDLADRWPAGCRRPATRSNASRIERGQYLPVGTRCDNCCFFKRQAGERVDRIVEIVATACPTAPLQCHSRLRPSRYRPCSARVASASAPVSGTDDDVALGSAMEPVAGRFAPR